MADRPLQALRGLDGWPLARAVLAAMRGTGPAVLPIGADLPEPAVRRLLAELRPHTLRSPDGVVAVDSEAPGVAEDVAVVMATSGSTGRPKGVELPGAALEHSVRASLRRLGGPSGPWLCVLPTSHVAGLQVLLRAAVSGGELWQRPFDAAAVSAVLREAPRPPTVSLVPTQLGRLLRAGADPSGFAAILLGGAVVDPALLREARAAGARVVTTYGMTETCGGCVYDGRPLAGVRAAVGDGGRIHLGGPVVARGYRLRPELDRDSFTHGSSQRWFVTGDVGGFDAAGALTVRGRADDVIVTGGHNVDAHEVAARVRAHPEVLDAAVVGRPDPEWGQRVVAVVVPRDGARPPGLDELREWTALRLPRHAAPREVEVRTMLPMLANGKHDLAALRHPVGDVGTMSERGTSQ